MVEGGNFHIPIILFGLPARAECATVCFIELRIHHITCYWELLRRSLNGRIRIDVFRRGFVTEGQIEFVGDLGPEFA
jgi:hypothetical protein